METNLDKNIFTESFVVFYLNYYMHFILFLLKHRLKDLAVHTDHKIEKNG